MLPMIIGAAAAMQPSSKMLAREPVMSLSSAQTADAVQQCIGLGLSGIGRPLVVRVTDRRFIGFANMERTPVLVTIIDGSPTRIEVRRSFSLSTKWRHRIEFCAA